MFCPNCGKNCGDANFCAVCGTRLPGNVVSKTPAPVWTVGMPCPHCGGTKLDGNQCSFCGAQLIADIPKGNQQTITKKDTYTIPFGEYGPQYARMRLEKDSIFLHRIFRFKTFEVSIPYHEITEVRYIRPGPKWTDIGCLTICGKNTPNRTLAIREDIYCDRYAISFPQEKDLFYYHLFHLLRVIAPQATAQFSMDILPVKIDGLENILQTVDMDSCFEKYNPYREGAISALCTETGMRQNIAKTLVDHIFDQKQAELYYRTPALAIRDFNRILPKHL